MPFLSYNDFCEAQHPLAELVTRLHDVDDLALLLLARGKPRHGLAQIGIELLAQAVDLGHALAAQRLGKLLRNEPHARAQSLDVVALLHGGNGPLHVVAHGQHLQQHVAAARLDELHLLTDRPLAEVVELGLQTQVLVLPLGNERREIGALLRCGLCRICQSVSRRLRLLCHIVTFGLLSGRGSLGGRILLILRNLLVINLFLFHISCFFRFP